MPDLSTVINESACYQCYGASLGEGIELALLSRAVAAVVDPRVNTWAQRVVTNGGATPSQQTQLAMSTFIKSLDSSGLTSKMEAVLICVPDNLIAATTPLIVGSGFDPWTNHAFAATDLNVYGLKGDMATKYLETGVLLSASKLTVSNSGLSVFSYSPSGKGERDIGTNDGVNFFQLSISDGDNCLADCWNAGTQRILTSNAYWCGYTSMSRVAGADFRTYRANIQNAHAQLGATNAVAGGAIPTQRLYAFAMNNNGAPLGFSRKRMRAFAIHQGLSSTDSANLAAAFQVLDTQLEAFTGTHPIVTNWASRVVTNGGASPSAATQAALTTFCSALDTADIMRLICVMNPLVPDNLIAAQTGLIIEPTNTNDPFTNSNFVAGDLTVNGLLGNAVNKKLDTGFNASIVFTATAGGAALYNTTSTNSTEQDMGANNLGANQFQFHISFNVAGTGTAICDMFNDTTSRIQTANNGWTGYITMQRTLANVYQLYRANSVTPHANLGGVNANVNASTPPAPTVFVFAMNNNGGGGASFSGKRLSFMSLNYGMTQAQSLSFFNAIQAMRTALGGGFI
jgi:hypothetical protein